MWMSGMILNILSDHRCLCKVVIPVDSETGLGELLEVFDKADGGGGGEQIRLGICMC